MMDSLSPKPVIELDFRLLTHLPSNADGFGVQMTPAGISLSGPKAYLNLPLALPIGAYLKSKSILVCLRFVNSRESIQLGLESSDGMRSEKLAIGSDLEGVPHGVWVLHRSSQLPTTTFGSSAPVEHEINFDIHLALVVDASRPPTATFTCYRESEQYGQPARLGGLAVFQGSDGIVFTIQHSGSGRVVYSYVKIFDRALSEDEVRQIDLSSAMAGSASASQGEAVPVDTSATNVGQSSLTPMKPSPAHPERWTLKQQQNAAQQESQIDTAYSSGEYKKHVAHVHNFRAACNDRGVDYADALLTGDMTAEEYRKARLPRQRSCFLSYPSTFLLFYTSWTLPFEFIESRLEECSLLSLPEPKRVQMCKTPAIVRRQIHTDKKAPTLTDTLPLTNHVQPPSCVLFGCN
eukprot:TRINITY_DN503_c0_g1_i2.p1 TRINITY_DN503_c0_g1~~TRINITY_DN503_c0_g1_i2.p1  ORF type:complete len:406 (+),score=18.59 TRINITY_DN503_c0_g1_i2:254-1471(+)